jgi:hypothetical protein
VVLPGPARDDRELIAAVFPRRTAFVRERSGAETAAQALAANVDGVSLVCGLNMELNAARMERYLAPAWQSGAIPVVLVKVDACSEEVVAGAIGWCRGIASGVDVRAISATTGEGIEERASAHLGEGRTVAMLGPSGVGKSSLINALAPTQLMSIAATRRDGKADTPPPRASYCWFPVGGCCSTPRACAGRDSGERQKDCPRPSPRSSSRRRTADFRTVGTVAGPVARCWPRSLAGPLAVNATRAGASSSGNCGRWRLSMGICSSARRRSDAGRRSAGRRAETHVSSGLGTSAHPSSTWSRSSSRSSTSSRPTDSRTRSGSTASADSAAEW